MNRFKAPWEWRRVGELTAAQKESIGLNVGGRTSKTGPDADPANDMPTLAQAGIDKYSAELGQWLLAQLSDQEIEAAAAMAATIGPKLH